ncbi:MAG: UDP-2,3-diacylglucosamine diphosphatase, partial [Aeromonas sp.]
MTTLFISDLHLSATRPDMTACLLDFLRIEARGADALYILGDLFEFWIGDDDPSALHTLIAAAFYDLSQSGVPIYFVHGNRDFLLGDPVVITLYGERALLMHGDLLCTLDTGYQRVRRITSWRGLRGLFLHLPRTRRQAIAAKM